MDVAALTEHRAEVGDVPIRWLEGGDGLPTVLTHGIPTSPALWRRVIPMLDRSRVLAWEMVGYGLSWPAGRGRDISVAAQARYLLEWLDSLGIDRAILVGHDLGGGVSQIAATREPDRCAGLVLTNSISYDSWPVSAARVTRRLGPLVERLPRPLFRSQLRLFLRMLHDDAGRADESFAEHWTGYDHPEGGAAFIRQLRSLRTADTLAVAERLSDLRVPAELVWGAADRFQTIEYGHRLAADLKGDLHPIPGGKHFVPEDHPEPVASAINTVVEQAAAAPRAAEPIRRS